MPDDREAASRSPRCAAQAGYSLLEVLVALAILSLAVAVIVPDMRKGLSAASRRTLVMDVERYVLDARRMAMDSDVAVVIAAPAAAGSGFEDATTEGQITSEAPGALRPSLPPGWAMLSDAPLTVDGSGACTGGRLVVRRPGEADAAFMVSSGVCAVAPA